MPSADIRSNRCVPLRGTSAGYASASSAFIWLLKSGGTLEPLSLRVCCCDELKVALLIFSVNSSATIFRVNQKKPALSGLRCG